MGANLSGLGYSWSPGNVEDPRIIVKYLDREIGRVDTFNEVIQVQKYHRDKLKNGSES